MSEDVNNELVAEYVEVLKTKLNHFVDEAVALKARLQYTEKGVAESTQRIQDLQNEIGKRENDIEELKKQLEAEKAKPAQVVEKAIEVESDSTATLMKENELLKRELLSLENKVMQLKKSKSQEMTNGDNTEAKEIRDS